MKRPESAREANRTEIVEAERVADTIDFIHSRQGKKEGEFTLRLQK
jgi:hypothetical protein